jgi:hypothetical protein
MNEKAARMSSAAVALSALAAVLASTANARIPEGAVVPAAASTSPVVRAQHAPRTSGTFGVDPEIYATLDPAIKAAIQASSHVSPLAAKVVQGESRARHAKTAPLPHGVQVGLP